MSTSGVSPSLRPAARILSSRCVQQTKLQRYASFTATVSTNRPGRYSVSVPSGLSCCPRTILLARSASTSSIATPRASSAAPADAGAGAEGILDWNTFFQLRKVRRRYNLVASMGTAAATTMVGISILSQQEVEAMGGQLFGLDPVVVLGLATAGFGAAGWLAGPALGNMVFGVVNKRYKGQMALKEKEFFDRIKRHRVDPSSQSFSNPVPDYYGEKIGSVRDYRQWLKDQRAYNKKRQSFV